MSVVDTAKIVGELVKKGATIELQEKIMQLREEALELQEDNQQLKKENAKLREQVEWKQKLRRSRALYWCDGDDTPFCPYCWERNKLALHLSTYKKIQSTGETVRRCQECKITYTARGESDFCVTGSRVS